jgi:hypothetical protein
MGLATFRPNWRGLGLTLLGAVLYFGGDIVYRMMGTFSPFAFIPSLFGVLFGPWVGGFAGALGAVVGSVFRRLPWSLPLGFIGPFALGMLPGLMVKDARNWKEVLGAGAVAGVISALLIAVSYGILLVYHGYYEYYSFAEYVGPELIAQLPSNIFLLPLFARWLVGPVRRWGLYRRDRQQGQSR